MPWSPELIAVMLEMDRVIDAVETWDAQPAPAEADGARAYIGTHAGWRIVVVDFDIVPQGFPPGSRGHDGAASHRERAIVYHLTRTQAERAFARAHSH